MMGTVRIWARMLLKTVCALSTVTAVCAGLTAAIVPALAQDGDAGDSTQTTPIEVTDAIFQWGVNDESGGGAYFGGCNFLSAGEAGDNGAAGLWPNDNTFYSAKSGNVEILKPTADGTLAEPTWATKCTNQYGTSINGRTQGLTMTVANPAEGVPAQQPTYSGNVVRIAAGTGTADPSADSAHIEWKGSFTIVYYGGMTYWTLTDPVLDVKDGKGTITATASGYGADMDDASKWVAIDPQEIHLADLQNTKVDVTDQGLTVTPDFLGVAVPEGVSGRNDQAERTDENAAWWGAFPESWLRFATLTGQTSYWWTSAGGANTIQPRKPAAPIAIAWGGGTPVIPSEGAGLALGATSVKPGESLTITVTNPDDGVEYAVDIKESDGQAASGMDAQPGADAHSFTVAVPADAAEGTYTVELRNKAAADGDAPVATATFTVAKETSGGDNGGGDNNGGDNGGGDNNNGGGDQNGDTAINGATLRWSMNEETNSASYYGGCNFLSAGVAGNTGSSRLWTEQDGFFAATAGNVQILKPDASGQWVATTWATKCQDRNGQTLSMTKTSTGHAMNSESQVVLSGGTGTAKADGSVTISWKGSWTVAFYGGMTYWSVTDPTLTLDASGNGALTATASGYGADMYDTTKWVTLEARTIHVADFKGVDVGKARTDHGFTHTPEYLGVAVNASGDHGGQAAKDAENASVWGSFPQSFVDFQTETGQTAYWYTSNSQRDYAKPTLPMNVCYDQQCTADAPLTDYGQASAKSTGSGSAGKGSAGSGTSASGKSASSGKTAAASGSNGAANAGAATQAAADPNAGAGLGEVAPMGNPLIEDNARTIALGSGSVAAATALPLGLGWVLRRRLGLDAGAELDRRLGLR